MTPSPSREKWSFKVERFWLYMIAFGLLLGMPYFAGLILVCHLWRADRAAKLA